MVAAAAGCRVAHYRLEAPVGYGGMGVVFLALDTHACRQVAIKVVPADRLDQQARGRLREETLMLTRLSHPNIAAVLDFGSHGDMDYIVMEFVRGTTLDVTLKAGPLASWQVASLGWQLARGLSAAHASGIIHRDIKPGNLRVTPEGLLKILDFGVASFPAAGAPPAVDCTPPAFRGTLQYMPPERLRGMPAGARADIFSAGAVLYEMACGRAPFHHPQPVRLIESILCGRPARPSTINPRIEPGLESIIMRALDPDPARRFAHAIDLADALDSVAVPRPLELGAPVRAIRRWAARFASALLT